MSLKMKLIIVMMVALLGGLYIAQRSEPTVPAQGAHAALEVGHLSAQEVEKQAKDAIDAIVARKDAQTVKENIGKLRALVAAPSLPLAKLAERREGVSRLEKVAMDISLRQIELQKSKEAQLSAMKLADAAIEKLVAPQAGSDAYLAGLLKQYQDYSGTLQLVLQSLFAEPTLKAQETALLRLQGMAPTALDNVRVLGLEIKGLAENAQIKGGIEALQQLLQPEKGSVAAWMTMTHDSELMQQQAAELLTRFHP